MAELEQRVSRIIGPALTAANDELSINTSIARGQAAINGASGGSAHRQYVRQICVTALHERIEIITTTLIWAHQMMNAPASDVVLVQCKDWLAHRAHAELLDVSKFLYRPRPEFAESPVSDNLEPEFQRELSAANARLDGEFDRLRLDRTRTWVRWVNRTVNSTRRLIGI
jgi:hypothetical protein